jgi:hypothetical protein
MGQEGKAARRAEARRRVAARRRLARATQAADQRARAHALEALEPPPRRPPRLADLELPRPAIPPPAPAPGLAVRPARRERGSITAGRLADHPALEALAADLEGADLEGAP